MYRSNRKNQDGSNNNGAFPFVDSSIEKHDSGVPPFKKNYGGGFHTLAEVNDKTIYSYKNINNSTKECMHVNDRIKELKNLHLGSNSNFSISISHVCFKVLLL